MANTIRNLSLVSGFAALVAVGVIGGEEELLPIQPKPDAPPAAEQAPVPKAVPVEARHDFGTVWQGEKVVHIFKVRNDGKADLIIERAQGT